MKIQTQNDETFGDRLARLRSKAGYTQRDLARETGISQRMIAYYEKQTQYPPTHLLPLLSKALGASADELLGLKWAGDKHQEKGHAVVAPVQPDRKNEFEGKTSNIANIRNRYR